MLLDEYTDLKLNSRNIKRLQELGYDGKIGDTIKVAVNDLTRGSSARVHVLCDYCKDTILNMSYYTYCNSIKENGKTACKNCIHIKTKEYYNNHFGIDNCFQLDSVKEKIKQTCLEKYGCENYASTKEQREKMKETSLKKYGVEFPNQNDEIKIKHKQTCLEKYGVDSPFKIPQVKEKIKNTLNTKYGVDNIFELEEIQNKIAKIKYDKSNVNISRQQKYLNELFGGILNYPIEKYNVDIYLEKDNIICEYNGSGHNLQVKFCNITQEEQRQKEIIRSNIIKRAGYKQIIIISSQDYLPSDETLLKMLEQAKEYFNTTKHTWVEYNIDTSLMRNAEHKDGVFFNYGKLKKIRKEK